MAKYQARYQAYLDLGGPPIIDGEHPSTLPLFGTFMSIMLSQFRQCLNIDLNQSVGLHPDLTPFIQQFVSLHGDLTCGG